MENSEVRMSPEHLAMEEIIREACVDEGFEMTSLPKIAFEEFSPDSYSLNKRESSKKLASCFIKALESAKLAYDNEVAQALKNLKTNFAMAHKMDRKLGVPTCDEIINFSSSESDEDSNEPKSQKDGSRRLQCPFIPCKIKTFKLRRHMNNAHPDVSSDQVDYGIKVARLFENNKTAKPVFQSVETKLSARGSKNTILVNRRSNYKRCSLCETLCINMTNHIKRTHGISNSDSRYYSLVTECPVIPKCYIKIENNKAVELTGEEMEVARNKFSTDVETQGNTLKNLRNLREKIAEVKTQIEESNDETKQVLQSQLQSLYDQYSKERYKDCRIYTTRVLAWKDSFIAHLNRIECTDSKRIASMAIDVLLPFESKTGQDLCYSALLNGKIMRELLTSFKETSHTSSASKIKYICSFQKLLNFLTFDIDSPEISGKETNEQLIVRERSFKVIQFEIENMKKIIMKGTGAEKIISRKAAKEKLLSKDETDKLLEEIDVFLLSTFENFEQEKVYSRDETIKVRDHLMAACTLRMGRRTKELLTMTEDEARNCQKKNVNGSCFYIIEVLDQKSTKSGKAAAVVLNEIEYKVLVLYLDYMKRILSGSSTIVFPSSCSSNRETTNMLSFGAACNLLNKFKTESGKKLSTRVARASKVTNSRKQNLSLSNERKLAEAMNHSHAVSERYYNFSEASDAAVAVLSFDCEDCEPTNTSTPVKRKLAETDEMDETILTLRNKKIKKSNKNEQLVFLKERIEELIADFKLAGKLDSFKTATGNISINPIKNQISKSTLKLFSIKEIKEVVEQILNQ